MNLVELRNTFDAAVANSKATNREDLPEESHRDAGIRAVVKALWNEMDDKGHYEIHCVFTEILGGSDR